MSCKILFSQWLLLLNIFIFLIVCHSCLDTRSGSGYSESVEFSKKHDLFICEYELPTFPYKINDSISIKHKYRIWLEKGWVFDSENDNLPKPTNHYRMIFIFDSADVKGKGKTWIIGEYDRAVAGRSKSKEKLQLSSCDFKELPKTKEIWAVYDITRKGIVTDRDNIGVFEIIKRTP